MIKKEKFIRKIRIGRLSTFGGRLLIYAFLTGISYLLLFPFLYMVVTSVKNYSDLYDFTVKWVPHEFHWQNYAIAYNLLNYWNHFGNSLMLTTVCTLGHLLSYLAEERPELTDEYLRDHLLTWAPHYLEALEEAADHPFYQGLAALTRSTLLGLQEARGLEVVTPRFYR